MRNLVQTLKLSGSTAAIVAATISFGTVSGAQAQNAAAVEQVQVTASRISIAGYQAPTPVTVVNADTIARDAHLDLGTQIRQLPAVGQSWSPDTGSNSGQGSQGNADLSTIELRNLGNIRTLVLFDGQRVVMSNPNAGTPPFAIGGVDLSTLPQAVVQRVEVVTGGASAAWGSYAVAGVVNLVIDKRFSGIKGSINLADTEKEVCRLYDVIREKIVDGHPKEFLQRSTFIIDKKGVVRHIMSDVNPKEHVEEVLKVCRQLLNGHAN